MVTGKEFRSSFKKHGRKSRQCRVVPAFSFQVRQKGTCILPPPKLEIFKPYVSKAIQFRQNYTRGTLPISRATKGRRVSWKVDIGKLDFHYYLPMFFEALMETEEPYRLFARHGIHEMLVHGGQKIFPCIPQLIIPIKNALRSNNKDIMCATLIILKLLIKSSDLAGQALVPYYRQFLPTLNYYKDKNVNCGDEIDYSQMRGDNLADLINETLEMLETYGGDDAFINIKYLIPTYESCMMN